MSTDEIHISYFSQLILISSSTVKHRRLDSRISAHIKQRLHNGPKYSHHWRRRLHVRLRPSAESNGALSISHHHHSGGTVIADLLSRRDGPLQGANLTAAVRSSDAIPSLRKLGIDVAHFGLEDEAAAKDVVLKNQSAFLVTPQFRLVLHVDG